MITSFKRFARPIYNWMTQFVYGYRTPRKPSLQLSPYSTESSVMKMEEDPSYRPQGDLYSIWQQIPGGHKWWHYFAEYERILGTMRSKPIRLLEMGVYKGGSLTMWRRYLHPDSIIVGLDIDTSCAQFDRPAENVHVRIGDQSNFAFLKSVVDEFGPFDVIIDDGSHICSHMIRSFDYLFLNGLTPSGVYIAEDTHSNLWLDYRDQLYSFLDLCKDLVDLSHAHYFRFNDKPSARASNSGLSDQCELGEM
jgi:hypothetical protein